MKIMFLSICLALLSLTVQAKTVCYQPTPYPDFHQQPGSTNNKGVHIWDRYVGGKKIMPHQDARLIVGHDGKRHSYPYMSFIKFDLDGLPQKVSKAVLHLSTISVDEHVNLVARRVTTREKWKMTGYVFATRLSIHSSEDISIKRDASGYMFDMTEIYNRHKNGEIPHFGIRLRAFLSENGLAVLHSSSSEEREKRPKLCLTFESPIPIPDFKIPLPENASWLITTEIGGFDCKGVHTPTHDNKNWYSIDFSPQNVGRDGKPVYDTGSDIPILASADGVVITAGDNKNNENGYYVIIDHDSDGDVKTGFSTRYLHMRYPPLVRRNDYVSQGQILGYMGSTGRDRRTGEPTSTGVHLHFGVRYEDTGYQDTPYLDYVAVDDTLLKGLQSECEGEIFVGYSPPSTNTQIE